MLQHLRINRLAVVDSLEVEFGKGLNVLTGETGSGKSVIVDALQLLLGSRASLDMIRTGESMAYVEGVFSQHGNAPLFELLDASGIGVDSDELIIKRELNAQGRGRVFVNNQAATAALLRAIQPHLVDIHGQGDQQSLAHPSTHLQLLDGYANSDRLTKVVTRDYDKLLHLIGQITELEKMSQERTRDILEFQLNEIERAGLQEGEDEKLESQRLLLSNAERLAELGRQALSLIYEDESSASSAISRASRSLDELGGIDLTAQVHADQLRNVLYVLEDTSSFLQRYIQGIEVSPEQLAAAEERLHELGRLKRKYGGSLEKVILTGRELREQIENLGSKRDHLAQLTGELNGAFRSFNKAANELSALRRKKASDFETAVLSGLAEVALERSSFSIRFTPITGSETSAHLRLLLDDPSVVEFVRTGMERVEFFFSANPGEAERGMGDVASGGELSRLMLIIKNVASPSLFPRTLVFDEIDAGIGGGVSEAVGKRLKHLAKGNQVLCVTHQAQIARHADLHFLVSKRVTKERTVTEIKGLSDPERVEELARMIAGATITPVARKHAREMLQQE